VTIGVVLRADASTAIGTGHVMRCLTLAEEMIARGWAVTLLSAELPDALAQRAASIGVAVEMVDASPDPVIAAAQAVDAVVLDSYAVGPAFRAKVQAVGRPVLTLDDGPFLPALHADLVLNPAPSARAERYAPVAPGATLLLGPRFALIRREIRAAAAAANPDAGQRSRLLVLFGGSDPLRLTGPVARALQTALPAARITVVLGAAAAPVDEHAAVDWLRDPSDLPGLMAEAGLAVSAAGGTLGELAVCGVPTVAAMVADNQAAARSSMPGWGVAVDARAPNAVGRLAAEAAGLWRQPELRRQMGEAARREVDGGGAARVVDALAVQIAQCAR
jgi:UDP-2,4-diacetamido-2,4,6-trideoxy-beta-L-altropyranose hydrolase